MKKIKQEKGLELPLEQGGLQMDFSEKVTHGTNEQPVLAAFQKYKKAAVAQSRDPEGD